GRVSRVSAELASRLEGRGYRARPLPEHFDYVYRTEELAEMNGRRFDGKRNHMRRMASAHPGLEYRPLDSSYAADALSLFDAWREARSSSGGEGRSPVAFDCQRDALSRLFENFEELGVMGGKLMIDGETAGFVAGTAAKPSEACVHFCYTRPGLSGAFPFLIRESCRGCFSTFEFVNLEQDPGLPGIRKSKMSFYPAKLEEKYEITRGGR
ncbi:MAG TPA: phosphatidylglycerol lysyltransferase domain-containing protein, partial [bacterium]|nr:phosphatidylglycerol lysyltransferase domain-containing protein [bacterium]